MEQIDITEDMIFQCFAAAQQDSRVQQTAESFVDVEEYENQIMYPEFARWAEQAGHPELAHLFRKVAGEEKLHAVWLRELYDDIGVPSRGEDTQRAIDALQAIQALGGFGYTNESNAGRLLRDAKLYEIGAGTSEIRRMLIGRELFNATA